MAPPGEAAERARRFLKELEDRKQPAFDLILRQYRVAHQALDEEIANLIFRNARYELLGEGTPTPADLLARKQALLKVIEDRMAEYANAVEKATRGIVRDAAKAGLEHGAGQMSAWGITQGVSVNEHALAALMAQTNPTRNYIQAIPAMAKQHAERVLTRALILGKSPRAIAKELADTASIANQRALMIARTEMMRAYREGNRAQWAANSNLVHGWVWACTPSVRTCPVCFAQSGTFHPITESMTSHPNCRCTMIPVPTSYASSLAQYQLKPLVPKGEQQLMQLPAEAQKQILGPTRYEAFKNGASLQHMVETHWDPVYGTQMRLKKLPKPPPKPKAAKPLAGVVGKQRAPGVSIPANMSQAEHQALQRYTSSSSSLNHGLRSRPGMGAAAHDPHYYEHEQTVLLDQMMERTSSPTQYTVWRGASVHHYGGSFVDGAIIEDHGFLSTSFDPDTAVNFRGDLLLELTIPPGSRGIDVNGSTQGYHAHEREFLLPRGSRFRVDLAEQDVDRWGNVRWKVFATLITP